MLIQIGPYFLNISQSSGVMRCGRKTGHARADADELHVLDRAQPAEQVLEFRSLKSNSGSPPESSTSRTSGVLFDVGEAPASNSVCSSCSPTPLTTRLRVQ